MSRRTELCVILVITSLALSGCSVIMAASVPDPKNMNVLLVGTPRADVLKEFGEPEQTDVRDGRRVDTFKYKQGERANQKYGRAALHAGMDLLTFGIWEIIGTPTEIMNMPPETRIDVTYDEMDRVDSVGPAGIYWVKAGSTNADFHRENFECRLMSRPTGPPVVVWQPELTASRLAEQTEYQAENLYRDCMRARGYELRKRQPEEGAGMDGGSVLSVRPPSPTGSVSSAQGEPTALANRGR